VWHGEHLTPTPPHSTPPYPLPPPQDYETKHYLPWLINSTFTDVHVSLPETLARLSVEAGVTNFIHLGALGSDPRGLSAWARSKAAGEEAVRAVCPGATIVRPADVVGAEDRFLNLFARMYGSFPRVPLVNGGTARVQPLYVQDLAHAIHRIAISEDPHVMLSQTYDLAGPDEYTIREVVEYVFEAIRAETPEVLSLTPAQADVLGRVIGVLPFPLIERDRFLRFQVSAWFLLCALLCRSLLCFPLTLLTTNTPNPFFHPPHPFYFSLMLCWMRPPPPSASMIWALRLLPWRCPALTFSTGIAQAVTLWRFPANKQSSVILLL